MSDDLGTGVSTGGDGGFDPLDAIARHSAGLADAAEGNLEAAVEHCPAWTVADLVWHLTEVQWFWATIVEERLAEPVDEDRKPARGPEERLVGNLRAAAARLVDVLSRAEGDEHVWTWAPAQQDVAFVRRHQVQEAAVHHWDAVNAAGGSLEIEPAVAADSVSEFLTFSVSSEDDAADPPRPALDGRFTLRSSDAGVAWTLSDGGAPGTVSFREDAADDVPEIVATASELLLWLYDRGEVAPGDLPADMLERFRDLRFSLD